MAIFRNKEGDLPPLIPSSDPEQSAAVPTRPIERPVERSFEVSRDVSGLPTLPDHVAVDQQPAYPNVVPALPYDQPVQPLVPDVALPQLTPVVPDQQTPVAPMPEPPKPPEPQPVVPTPQEYAPVQTEQQPQSADQTEQGGLMRRRAQQNDDQASQQQSGVAAQQIQPKSREREEIEKMLSQGLSQLYQAMTPEQQEQFRTKGEETATAIEQMVTNFKATTRKVLGLIRGWLQFIPGVNKYFLEQESKLKTDDIMKYQRKLQKQRSSRITL